jgi:DNA-binding NarL/FixJ family response regulator
VEQASALGASGFLLKQTSAHVLAKAIRDVGEGRPFLKGPPSWLSLVVPRTARARAGNAAKKQRLTMREAEVLQLIAEGKGNKQIALELGVSFKTVDKHRQHLMIKLNVHDVAGLTRYAIHEGMIESGGQVTIK